MCGCLSAVDPVDIRTTALCVLTARTQQPGCILDCRGDSVAAPPQRPVGDGRTVALEVISSRPTRSNFCICGVMHTAALRNVPEVTTGTFAALFAIIYCLCTTPLGPEVTFYPHKKAFLGDTRKALTHESTRHGNK